MNQPDRSMTSVVRAAGEIDMSNAEDLAFVIAERMTPSVRRLVVDLTDVTFIGSAGIAVLVEARDRAMELGITLSIDAPHRAVRRPFEITGLADMFCLTDLSGAQTG